MACNRHQDDAAKTTQILFIDSNAKSLRVFNPLSGSVKELQFSKPDVIHYTVVSAGKHIYALGKDKTVHRLEYSQTEAAWERKADMIEEHGWLPHVAVISGCIYVIGGQWLFDYCAVERYDLSKNEWIRLEDKPEAVHGSAVVPSGRYIYSFGGFLKGQYTNDVTRLDTVTSQWKSLSSLNEERGICSAAEWENRMYVAGGQVPKSFLTSVERYDPSADQWTMLSRMNVGRSWFRLFAVDGCLYAVSGRRIPANCTIEKYEIDQNKWKLSLKDETVIIYDSTAIQTS